MKNFIYIICLSILLTSCASTKSTTAVRHTTKPSSSAAPTFLENITVSPSRPSPSVIDHPISMKETRKLPVAALSTEIETCTETQFKYAIMLEDVVENMTNEKLISFLDEWVGIPYRYGGDAKTGIDCSAFSSSMMENVYQTDIPRTCREQYGTGRKIRKTQLTQGDLVFFNTSGGVSHVGVYLGHNKFVHASTSSGVMISDLDESYFKRRYVGATRVR